MVELRNDKIGRFFDGQPFLLVKGFLNEVEQVCTVPNGDGNEGDVMVGEVGGDSGVDVLSPVSQARDRGASRTSDGGASHSLRLNCSDSRRCNVADSCR